MEAIFVLGGKSQKRVAYVELLTKILCEHVPDFWRLGQSYLSGKLLKEVNELIWNVTYVDGIC